MSPVIAQVEHVDELLTRLQPGQVETLIVQKIIVIGVGDSDAHAVVELEFVQMGPVPSRKCLINGGGQLTERVTGGGCKESTWSRPKMLATALNQLHAH